MRQLGAQTLLREWPEPRSTNDLDLFLRPELLIQSAKLKPLAEAIARLGYQVVPGAEKYQFVKPGPGGDRAGHSNSNSAPVFLCKSKDSIRQSL